MTAGAQSTIFSETMGTVAGTTAVSVHEAANGFDNDAYTMTAGGAAATGDVRVTSVSSGYTNSIGNVASGSANIFFSAGLERGFAIEGVNGTGFSDITIEFGYRKEASGSNAPYSVQWSTNSGANWNSITLSNTPAGNAAVSWYLIKGGLPAEAAASGLSIRWVRDSVNGNSMRIDDVLVRGNSGSAPEVIITTSDATFPFETNTITVAGTANANTIGELSWTNTLTGGAGTIAATASWSIPGISLSVGTNVISVSGTNSTGLSSMDSVSIIRSPQIVTNVQFTAASASTPEISTVVTITVYRTTSDGNVSGQIALSGTANETLDYTVNTTNFIMNGATTSATIEVTIIDDIEFEGADQVVLTIVNVVGGSIGSPSVFTLTINANDSPPLPNSPIWINEFNYDDPSTDSNEFVEVAGPAGTDLSLYSILLMNGGDGASYSTIPLSGTIDDEGCGYGAVSFAAPGIQNGAPDGIAIVSNGTTFIQFISYEGSFSATNGIISVEVGGDFAGGEDSLQLIGSGNSYSAYSWSTNTFSAGSLNAGQTITPCGSGGTTISEYDVNNVIISGGTVSVTVNVTSNGVPYSLLFTTNLLTTPVPTGTADTEVATGGPVTLQDTSTVEPVKHYWIRTND